MNLILLFKEDFVAPYPDFDDDSASLTGRAKITGRRAQHIAHVIGAEPGTTLSAGLCNGLRGEAIIESMEENAITLSVSLSQPPAAPLDITLVLALPRPKVLGRVIRSCTELGIKSLYLINAYRVEKSYWQSPRLQADHLREQSILGLEQCGDTVPPDIHLRPRFKPFVEDELSGIIAGNPALLAHPDRAIATATALEPYSSTPITLCIGPEGGFIPFEIELLQKTGCVPVSLGERIYRVETVIPYLIGKLA